MCLILSTFFFLGWNIYFLRINIEIEKKQDNFLSKILTKLTEKPSKFIAAIGNNIALSGLRFGGFTDASDQSLGYHFSDLLNLLIKQCCLHDCF
jgi:hypothetical protein